MGPGRRQVVILVNNYFSLATNLVCFLVLCRLAANLLSPFFIKSLSFEEK